MKFSFLGSLSYLYFGSRILHVEYEIFKEIKD